MKIFNWELTEEEVKEILFNLIHKRSSSFYYTRIRKISIFDKKCVDVLKKATLESSICVNLVNNL